MFKEREQNSVIPGFVFNPNSSGAGHRFSVQEGDLVFLKLDQQTIMVRILHTSSNETFEGVIEGFEPTLGIDYRGLNLGQEITFAERHIFGCNKA